MRAAPTALIELDGSDQIIWCNDSAIAMGFENGKPVREYCSPAEEPLTEYARGQPPSHLYQFRFPGSEKRCHVKVHSEVQPEVQTEKKPTYLWVIDISESLIMADRMRRVKTPDAKRNRQLSQLSATALGYAELLDVVMSDAADLSIDKIDTVRKYQLEISRCLRGINKILQGEAQKPPSGSVLVAERHQALKELVSELLKAEGYKVHDFSDVEAALEYCRLNAESIEKAVIDETLKDDEGCTLIDRIKEILPQISIVALVESESGISAGGVRKPLDFQVLLRALAD
jgi:CheY-like chemotaxis protein